MSERLTEEERVTLGRLMEVLPNDVGASHITLNFLSRARSIGLQFAEALSGERKENAALRARAEQVEQDRDVLNNAVEAAGKTCESLLDDISTLRTRAEQAEARLANTQPYIRRAQELEAERDALLRVTESQVDMYHHLEAERDALRAEAVRLREALQITLAYGLPPNDVSGAAEWERARAALSSTPLSAAAVERVRLLEEIADDIIGWKTDLIGVGASDDLVKVTVRRGILDKLAALDDGGGGETR